MGNLLGQLINLYVLCIFGRIILSYFPLEPGGAAATIFSYLYRLTEPVLGPVRRVMPTFGVFDLSPIVVVIVLRVIASNL